MLQDGLGNTISLTLLIEAKRKCNLHLVDQKEIWVAVGRSRYGNINSVYVVIAVLSQKPLCNKTL